MSRRVAITGGAGFIGSALVRDFEKHHPDWVITVVDDFSSGLESNLEHTKASVLRGSVLDYGLLRSVFDSVDSVVHLAAISSVPRSVANPRPTHEANTTGTFNVLDAARQNGVNQVVVASSSSVYGANPNLPRNELDWTRPLSPYAVTKLATEAYANAFNYSYGLNTLAFRFFNVYGPRQRADHPYAAVVPKFISAALAGERVTIFGDGNQSRDFTFVDSVCEAIRVACEQEVRAEGPLNLAFGSKTTINQLLAAIEITIGKSISAEFVPARAGDVTESSADATQFRRMFPMVEPISLTTGLEETARWFQGL